MQASKRGKPLAALALMALITLAAVLQLDATGGTVASHEMAVVKSLAAGSGSAEPLRMATVQRSDGSVVQAPLATSLDIRPGEEVELAAYRRLLSRDTTYRVVGRRDEH